VSGGGLRAGPGLDGVLPGRKAGGARKGFNPRRKGRASHHPLLAALAEAPFILHGWLRGGNTGPARGAVPFLREALALLPEGTSVRAVRDDSGFFDGEFLGFLEGRALPYVIVARLTRALKGHCAGIKDWTPIDEHHAAGEFTLQLFGWSKARRFVVVRERERESQAAVGGTAAAKAWFKTEWLPEMAGLFAGQAHWWILGCAALALVMRGWVPVRERAGGSPCGRG